MPPAPAPKVATPSKALDALFSGPTLLGELVLVPVTGAHHLCLQRLGNALVTDDDRNPVARDFQQALALLTLDGKAAYELTLRGELAVDLAGADLLARIPVRQTARVFRAVTDHLNAAYAAAPQGSGGDPAGDGAEGPLAPSPAAPAAAGCST